MRFATSDLPAHLTDQQRAAAWTAALAAAGGGYSMRVPRVEDFFASFELKTWGELRLGVAIASSFELERTHDHIAADKGDDVALTMNRGRFVHHARQLGRDVEIHPGGLALFDLSEPLIGRAPDGAHIIRVVLPRRAFGTLDIKAASAKTLDGKSEVGRLVRDLVNDLLRRDLSGAGLAEATVAYLGALLSILASGEPSITTHPHAINHTRLRRARAMIGERYGDSAFSVAQAADELGISRRHLQSLFAAEGETFSDCLSACRLDAAYVALRSSGGSPESIADIADRCGFGDISTFYRRFGARYGHSPTQIRAEHELRAV